MSQQRSTALTGKFSDFWLLGGMSILIWVFMMVGELLRGRYHSVDQHFLQVAATFGLLGLLCNHPHFMVSYRFGYGRGKKFIQRHWFSLVLVPLFLVAAYALAFYKFDMPISENPWTQKINLFLAKIGLAYRVGAVGTLGAEVLSLSVWLMYFTVGWHYAKQVFGCMMVYASYDQYLLPGIQRKLLVSSVFSVAFYNFIYMNTGENKLLYFFNVPLSTLGLSPNLLYIAGAIAICAFLLTLYFVFYKNYKEREQWPSRNFLVPWIAFYIWWIPITSQKEFYIMMVPFFHSLQYLPFAYRVERAKMRNKPHYYRNFTLKLLLLLLVGFLVFEGIPELLDTTLSTEIYQSASFFAVAFLVFINIHHYFIDSVSWKFKNEEVRTSLLFD